MNTTASHISLSACWWFVLRKDTDFNILYLFGNFIYFNCFYLSFPKLLQEPGNTFLPSQSHSPTSCSLSFKKIIRSSLHCQISLGCDACSGESLSYHMTNKKSDSPSPSSYQIPITPHLEVGLCAHHVSPMLRFCLVWAHTDLMHVVTLIFKTCDYLPCVRREHRSLKPSTISSSCVLFTPSSAVIPQSLGKRIDFLFGA